MVGPVRLRQLRASTQGCQAVPHVPHARVCQHSFQDHEGHQFDILNPGHWGEHGWYPAYGQTLSLSLHK